VGNGRNIPDIDIAVKTAVLNFVGKDKVDLGLIIDGRVDGDNSSVPAHNYPLPPLGASAQGLTEQERPHIFPEEYFLKGYVQ
jgi:hypothetical protein